MNTYVKHKNKWVAYDESRLWCYRDLKWYEWFDLRFIQLRDWLHLLGKEK